MGNLQDAANATIAGFKKNDPETLRRIYQEVYPMVRSHILKNNGNEDHAKDLFQEAFVACWKNIKDDKFTAGNVSAYLFTIARNKWTDYLRSSQYKKTLASGASFLKVVTDEPGEEPEMEAEEKNRIALQGAFARLGNQCRALLQLFYFERKSMEEIAAETGLAPSSARNQKYRCMEKLRELSLQIKNNGR